MKQYEPTDAMPREYRDLLIRLLTIQADSEIWVTIIQHIPWVAKAPTANDMWIEAKIVTEEIGHYRYMKDMLAELGVDVSYMERTRSPEERLVEAFKTPFTSWGDVAVFHCLNDRVGRYQLEEFVNCSYGPLARVAPKMIQEENFHVTTGTAHVAELCKTPEGRREAQEKVNIWYPLALDMFGHAESKRSLRYIEYGLKRRQNEEQRQQYIAETNPILEKLGLQVPDVTYRRRHL